MIRKHIKELAICTIMTVSIVLLLLLLVWLLEKWNLHVPGSREMWIGLIGAVIGGAFTMFGVLITIYKQDESETEKRRIENMPILNFQVHHNQISPDLTLACFDKKMDTSYFLFLEEKYYETIEIKVINNLCAFNFTIEGCAINGKIVPRSDFFSPAEMRITPDECVTFAFDCSDASTNIFCVVRFSYEDVFGNKYFQDVPFTYFETNRYPYATDKLQQIIELRDIKAPAFVNGSEKSLEDSLNVFMDYQTFSK